MHCNSSSSSRASSISLSRPEELNENLNLPTALAFTLTVLLGDPCPACPGVGAAFQVRFARLSKDLLMLLDFYADYIFFNY